MANNKITTSIESIRAAHRQSTMGLNLGTRVADGRPKKYDAKKDRRNWKKELNNESRT